MCRGPSIVACFTDQVTEAKDPSGRRGNQEGHQDRSNIKKKVART